MNIKKYNLFCYSFIVLIYCANSICTQPQNFTLEVDQGVNTCAKCQEGCSTCCDENICSDCKTGYILNQDTSACLKCLQQCIKCNLSLICELCEDGFYISPEGACEKCSDNCDICLTQTECQVCVAPFYLNAENTCSLCPAGCEQCGLDSSTKAFTCFNCLDGYFMNTSTKQCDKCVNGCQVCKNRLDCVTCFNDFLIKLPENQCLKCTQYCDDCKVEGMCERCQIGYFLDPDQKCQPCPSTRCLSCKSDNAYFCLECSKGFFINEGKCLVCPDQCTACAQGDNQCTACKEGYFLSSGSCTPCSTSCLKCTDSKQCDICSSDTYLVVSNDGSEIFCHACPEKCLKCQNNKMCLQCPIGYFFDGVACSNCSPNCLNCSGNECLKCSPGYYLEKRVCQICDQDFCKCYTDELYAHQNANIINFTQFLLLNTIAYLLLIFY